MQKTWLLLTASVAYSQSRPVPPPGIPVPAADRAELEAGLARLRARELPPDIRVFSEAVRTALQYNEFFKPGEIAHAKELLKVGQERADAFAAGHTPWASATGLVPRGYISKIDHSVQPYGLVVPPTF